MDYYVGHTKRLIEKKGVNRLCAVNLRRLDPHEAAITLTSAAITVTSAAITPGLGYHDNRLQGVIPVRMKVKVTEWSGQLPL